ncbi:ABC transporter [Brasilonema octagenarum UFV-E1]|uniref:ABC transporter n=1 Tax=Brasilonema sennae CENA114 TaxID=415709 RepID=A0A856MI80_9CYAN|nr:Gldg family protein [Brasilonema sennae]QDL09969.1 ABC transporter [Brasilonema sennae CENA114]QDL16321.1 ABC transporter [Brasilonema octagenarum UFV-E1]
MKLLAKKKPLKILFWFGPFLLAAGLTSGFVSQNWGPIQLTLIILGTLIIVLWLIWQNKQNNWLGQRSTQASTNALIATLAVLAILGLINFLGTRYDTRVDLTETKLFTLAPQSRELVRNLQVPAKILLFDVNQDPVDRDLLENYRRQSSKFSFEYIDPQARPGLARKFGVKDYGEVYLEFGDKRQLVQVVGPQQRLSEVKLTNSLQQISSISSAKVYLLQGHGEHELSGKGEGVISQAVKALNDKGYTTSALNLVEKSSIPQDANVVVVAGPKRSLFENEVKALQDYLNRGGNVMLMIDPDTDPKLESLLAQWGVKLDNRLAVDVSASVGLGPAAPLVTQYGKHPITKDFGNGISFYPLARPIDTNPVPGIQATPLLLTKAYPNSWAESDQQSENLKFNPESDRKGPLTLGVALTRKLSAKSEATSNSTPTPTPTATPQTQASPTQRATPTTAATPASPTQRATPTTAATPASPTQRAKPIAAATPQTSASPTQRAKPTTPATPASPTPTTTPTATATPASPTPSSTSGESRMVVLGNSDFIINGLFDKQLNGDVFLNSVTWLSQQDQQPLSISPKEVINRRINLTGVQALLLELSSLVILPLIGLVVAAIFWWIRR